MTRADWLGALRPGDPVVLVRELGAYPATVASLDVDKIFVAVSGYPRTFFDFVWRATGCRPEQRATLRPADADAGYPDPLATLSQDHSAW